MSVFLLFTSVEQDTKII